jgi:NAD(P)H-dependent FMN reductase
MSKPKLGIVIGSIRPNRFGGHAAQWIEEIARRRTDCEVELIDLKDYPMPLFAEEASPLYAPSKNEVAQRWQKKVGEFDAFNLHGCRIQSRTNRGFEECARLRLR